MCNFYSESSKGSDLEACGGRGVEGGGIFHRVDREDITIIILDTKLVPDFVMHACCFFIAGNRPVQTLPRSASKSLTHENRGAKS